MPEIESQSKVSIKPKQSYTRSRASSGSASMHSGDVVATTCEGMTLEEVHALAESFCGKKFDYSDLNSGMQRMNLGNRIRGKIGSIDRANAKALAKIPEDEAVPTDLISGIAAFSDAAAPFVDAKNARAAAAAEEAKAKAVAKAEEVEQAA